MLKSLLLIGTGGFAGSILRYLLTYYVTAESASVFPRATLLVNVLGCLVIGIIYGLGMKELASSEIRLLLATGVCGGFTTFSSFSFEFLILLQEDHLALAMLYASGSMMLGLAAVWFGLVITKSF